MVSKLEENVMEYSKNAQDKLQTPVEARKNNPGPEVSDEQVPDPNRLREQQEEASAGERRENKQEKEEAKKQDPDTEETSQFNTD